jgi:branched-chain amino acid transport system permease protein
MKDLAPYLVMIVVLMFRPYGLFGKRQVERI